MKQLLLFSILLFTTLFAQTKDFSIIIHKPFNAALFDVTQDYDRSISAVGFSKEFSQTSTSSQTYHSAFDYLADAAGKSGTLMRLLKVNNNAKILTNKNLSLHNFSKAVAVVKTPTNGYFIGGYTMDGSLLVLKLTASTHLVFSKQFGTKNYDRMNNLVLLSDGGILAVGSSVTSRSTTDNIFETGLGKNDIYLTRFSKSGQKLWSKKYGTKYDDRGIDAVEASDGSIIVISTTSYNKHKNVTLMRITENGNKMWLKHYKSETQVTPQKIICLHDNNFLVSLSQYNDAQKEQIRLIKFDLYRNILEDKKIFTTYPSILHDIKEFSDGTIVGVGSIKDTFNTDGLVMIIDSYLSLLMQNHYGGENYDTFNALTILNNSQVAVAGIHTDENAQETNMWLLKLNKDTTIAQKPMQTKSISKSLKQHFHKEVTEKKLIVTDNLNLDFIDTALYFKVGSYKLTPTQKQFLDTFSTKLSLFVKHNEERIKTIEVCGHTSSEWKNANFEQTYLKNEKLSLERSFSVLSYIFKSQDKQTQQILTKLFKGSALSYSKKIVSNANEDKEKSRRVSFKIILK